MWLPGNSLEVVRLFPGRGSGREFFSDTDDCSTVPSETPDPDLMSELFERDLHRTFIACLSLAINQQIGTDKEEKPYAYNSVDVEKGNMDTT